MDNKDKIIESIRLEFLSLIKNDIKGYFISFKKACEWIEIEETYNQYSIIPNARKKFNLRYLRDVKFQLEEAENENDLEKDFIMRKNENKISFPWFSSDGFKTFCMILSEPKSFYVRKYYIKIEKDYFRVLFQDAEETKKERDQLLKDLSTYKAQLENAYLDRDHYLNRNNQLLKINKNYNMLEELMDDKDMFTTGSTNTESLYYKSLETLIMKPVALYIINPEYMITKYKSYSKKEKKPKKNKNEEDSENENNNSSDEEKEDKYLFYNEFKENDLDEKSKKIMQKYYFPDYEQKFDNYSLYEIKDEDIELFFSIQSFNGAKKDNNNFYKVCDLLMYNKDHRDSVVKFLTEVDESCINKNIFKSNYNSIVGACRTKLTEICYEKIKSDKENLIFK